MKHTGERDHWLRRTCGYCGWGRMHYPHCPVGSRNRLVVLLARAANHRRVMG